ncbi:MAG: hypothetical protein LLF86_04010 [Nitrospiraceae bacterium]|nr:hypothetical protein [Nitrospiraceae bacterium]
MAQPFIIGIAAGQSGSGKTTLASALLKFITSGEQRAEHPSGSRILNLKRWGAIKFTRTRFRSEIISDPKILMQHGKDTWHMLASGAEKVLWVKSKRDDLPGLMPNALKAMSHLDAVIVEGNSAIEFSNPDIVIFLVGRDEVDIKASAVNMLSRADIIVSAAHLDTKTGRELADGRRIIRFDPSDASALLQMVRIMDNAAVSKLKEIISEKAVDNKLPCRTARKIAEEAGVPYSEIGKAANELNIKISGCELGCF